MEWVGLRPESGDYIFRVSLGDAYQDIPFTVVPFRVSSDLSVGKQTMKNEELYRFRPEEDGWYLFKTPDEKCPSISVYAEGKDDEGNIYFVHLADLNNLDNKMILEFGKEYYFRYNNPNISEIPFEIDSYIVSYLSIDMQKMKNGETYRFMPEENGGYLFKVPDGKYPSISVRIVERDVGNSYFYQVGSLDNQANKIELNAGWTYYLQYNDSEIPEIQMDIKIGCCSVSGHTEVIDEAVAASSIIPLSLPKPPTPITERFRSHPYQ